MPAHVQIVPVTVVDRFFDPWKFTVGLEASASRFANLDEKFDGFYLGILILSFFIL